MKMLDLIQESIMNELKDYQVEIIDESTGEVVQTFAPIVEDDVEYTHVSLLSLVREETEDELNEEDEVLECLDYLSRVVEEYGDVEAFVELDEDEIEYIDCDELLEMLLTMYDDGELTLECLDNVGFLLPDDEEDEE